MNDFLHQHMTRITPSRRSREDRRRSTTHIEQSQRQAVLWIDTDDIRLASADLPALQLSRRSDYKIRHHSKLDCGAVHQCVSGSQRCCHVAPEGAHFLARGIAGFRHLPRSRLENRANNRQFVTRTTWCRCCARYKRFCTPTTTLARAY